MRFHSEIKIWRNGKMINIKIESCNVLLSVSSEKQPIAYKRLETLLDGDKLPPFITYEITKELANAGSFFVTFP